MPSLWSIWDRRKPLAPDDSRPPVRIEIVKLPEVTAVPDPWQRWIKIAQICSPIISSISALIAVIALTYTVHNFRSDRRPWLSYEAMQISVFEGFANPDADFSVKNYGANAAVRGRWSFYVIYVNIPTDENISEKIRLSDGNVFWQPIQAMAPGQSIPVHIQHNLGSEQLGVGSDGKSAGSTMIFRVLFEYQDTFGTTHRTYSCHRIEKLGDSYLIGSYTPGWLMD